MRGPALLAILTFLAFLQCANAAGTFEIAPTTLNLESGHAGLLYISNNGADPVAIQIQPMDWRQIASADVLTASETLLASPPFLRLAPGERQVVRVMAVVPAPSREADYRLLVSQLPRAMSKKSAVNVLFQFNIPVFVTVGTSKLAASWSASARSGALRLTLHNSGSAALKISGISVLGNRGNRLQPASRLTYVLPGASHFWTVPDNGSNSLKIAARDERHDFPLDADIAVQR